VGQTIVKNYLSSLYVLVCWVCITSLGYAQPSTNIEVWEQKIEKATTDTLKIDLLHKAYDDLLASKPLHAKSFLDKALRLAQQVNYAKGVVEAYEKLGEFFEKQGAYSKSENFYQQAFTSHQKANNFLQIAKLYNKIGWVQAKQKNIDQAIENYKRAIEIYQQRKDNQGIAMSLTNMGGAYQQHKEYEKAIDKYLEGLALSDTLKDSSLRVKNLIGLGETHYLQKKYKEAEKYYGQLLGMSNANNRVADRLTAYQALADVASAQEKYEEAHRYLREYITLKELHVYTITNVQDATIARAKKQIEEIEAREKKIEEQRNRITQLAFIAGIAGLITFGILIFAIRSNRKTRFAYQQLASQKESMEAQNQALEEQKRQIEQQNEAINRKNELQEAAFQEIERKNKEITASINYAKRIQESILPTEPKIAEALPEHFIFFRPRDIVSGDFYWFTQRNGKIIMAALDCTGHGVPGAIMSMLGDSYLNQIIKLQGIIDPQHILDSLHHHIGIALNQEETQNQDGMDIAISVIDPEKKTMEYAGAGRPILIIQEGKMEVLESCKLPVGGFQRDRERVFEKLTFDLTKPTCFYVFSDGFQDQFGGAKGRKFAKNRLEELLFEIHTKPMPEQKKLLNKTLVEWMGENRQMDDILIIGVKLHF
jgi:serine phosphatase RsbU (regulator of sigma subunit)